MESKIDVVFTSEHLQYKTESKQLKPKSKKKKMWKWHQSQNKLNRGPADCKGQVRKKIIPAPQICLPVRLNWAKDVSRHWKELWWDRTTETGKKTFFLEWQVITHWHRPCGPTYRMQERKETFKSSCIIQHKMTDLFAVIHSSCLIFCLNVYAQLLFLTRETLCSAN